MASSVYLMDASALIDLNKVYPRKTFPKLWKSIDALIPAGRLLSCREVYRELWDEELVEWKKKHQAIFIAEREHFFVVRDVLREHIEIDDPSKEHGAHGDPFLVAMALHNQNQKETLGKKWLPLVIVTHEARVNSPRKLPKVASAYGIECITLAELFTREKWSF